MVSKDPKQDWAELLSAYLDDQLSSAQAAKVERRLAKDAEARQLLGQMREVSEMVGRLPRHRAPDDLAEAVLADLERETLLDQAGSGPGEAGHKHLRWRRLAAAAAMIMLGGIAVTIIYSILSRGPDAHPEQLVAMREPAAGVAKSPQASAPTVEGEGVGEGFVANAGGAGEAAATLVAGDAEVVRPTYGSIHLVVNAGDVGRSRNRLEAVLQHEKIERVVRSALDKNRRQYAFLCSAGQLGQIVQEMKQSPGGRIDLIVTDQAGQEEVIVSDVSEGRIMAVAAQPDHGRQMILARSFEAEAERDKAGEGELGALSVDALDRSTQELVAWFSESLVGGDPEVGDLVALGETGERKTCPARAPAVAAPLLSRQESSAYGLATAPVERRSGAGISGEGAGEADSDQLVAVVLVIQEGSNEVSDRAKGATSATSEPGGGGKGKFEIIGNDAGGAILTEQLGAEPNSN